MDNCYKTTSPDRYYELKSKAKEMRNEPTDAEAYLWPYLRDNALSFKFRRQHPIGDYIADFICLSSHIIVELDGSIHNEEEQIEHDRIRDIQLENLGFKTLRFSNDRIFNDLENVLKEIKDECLKK